MENPIIHNRCVELMEGSEYVIVQINNMRSYYRPNSYSVPQQSSEVYVGHLPRDMFEDELVPIFEAQGTIYKLRLKVSPDGFNCGFCLVQYYVPHHAQRAMLNLDGLEIRPGHRVIVKKAKDARRVFIGGFPRILSLTEIWEKLNRYVCGIQNIIMFPDRRPPYFYNRGFAFIDFDTREDAAAAVRQLSQCQVWDREITVNLATPQIYTNPAVMARVKILFIRNLAFNITHTDLRRFLERFADSITRIYRTSNYAFVHFASRHAAEICFEAIAGKVLGSTIIDVNWARPRFYKKFCVLAREARANRFL